MTTATTTTSATTNDPRWLASVPVPAILLDGDPLPAPVAARLAWLRVRRELNRPAACEFEVEAVIPGIRAGAALVVTVSGGRLFEGEVVAVEHRLGPDQVERVRLRAFDAGHLLRQRGEFKARADLTLGELVAAIAADAGLSAVTDADSARRPRVLQVGESDLALLNRLASAAGLAWREEGRTIHLFDPADSDVREVAWGAELIEAVLTADATRPTGEVRAVGWDPVRRATVEGLAVGPDFAPAENLSGGVHGVDADADDRARARLAYQAAASSTLRAVLRGDAGWRPGLGLRIADRPGEPYRLTSVEQVLDPASGWVTLVDSAPLPTDAGHGPEHATGFTLGTVLDVDDPERAGRIRVTLPALGELESEWLPVVVAGAGEGRGLLCLPRVDDLVVVLHALADPGRGVVLGGLYPGTAAEDAGLADDTIGSYLWAGPEGQLLRLTAREDRVRLANAGGSWLEFSDSGVLLQAATDLTIAAPGRRLLIRADTVDFERG
jgi:phage baseplate assembly protein gpV